MYLFYRCDPMDVDSLVGKLQSIGIIPFQVTQIALGTFWKMSVTQRGFEL